MEDQTLLECLKWAASLGGREGEILRRAQTAARFIDAGGNLPEIPVASDRVEALGVGV